jgi:hypothetical protein
MPAAAAMTRRPAESFHPARSSTQHRNKENTVPRARNTPTVGLRRLGASAVGLALIAALAACSGTKTVTVIKTVLVTPAATESAAPSTDQSAASSAPASSSAASSVPASSAPASSATAVLDPCTLLTQAEASTTVGLKLLPGDSEPPESCTYDSDPNGPAAQVSIFVGDGAKQLLDTDTRLGHTFTKLQGIGDEASQEIDNAFVRKGTTWYAISVLTDHSADQAAADAALLTAALRIVASRG